MVRLHTVLERLRTVDDTLWPWTWHTTVSVDFSGHCFTAVLVPVACVRSVRKQSPLPDAPHVRATVTENTFTVVGGTVVGGGGGGPDVDGAAVVAGA